MPVIEKSQRAAAVRYPVWLNRQGASVGLDGLTLEVAMPGERHRVRLDEVSELIVLGNIHITTPALHDLMRRGIPVNWLTSSGWFLGATTGFGPGTERCAPPSTRWPPTPIAVWPSRGRGSSPSSGTAGP